MFFIIILPRFFLSLYFLSLYFLSLYFLSSYFLSLYFLSLIFLPCHIHHHHRHHHLLLWIPSYYCKVVVMIHRCPDTCGFFPSSDTLHSYGTLQAEHQCILSEQSLPCCLGACNVAVSQCKKNCSFFFHMPALIHFVVG